MAKQLNKAVSGGGNINFQIGLTSDTTGLNQLKTSLTELQKMTSSDLMDINKNMNIQQANSQLKELKSMASMYQMDVEKVKELIDENAAEQIKKDVAINKAVKLVAEAAKEV